jgi:adenosylcobinamide-GDP ribazoletransferase
MLATLIAAVRFLTRVPVPGRATVSADLPGAIGWFPLVGALANAAVAGLAVGLALWWPPLIAAVLAVALGLLLTGGFHEDACADSADGLGGGLGDRERILTIMKDSRIGAYAGMALWVVLTLRVAVLVGLLALPPLVAIAGFALAGAWGRWSAAPLLRLPPLASGGLAKDIAAGGRPGTVVFATALAVLLTGAAWWLGVARAPAMALAAVAATAVWAAYLTRSLGGQCGDLLGAGNQLTEVAALLVLTAGLCQATQAD